MTKQTLLWFALVATCLATNASAGDEQDAWQQIKDALVNPAADNAPVVKDIVDDAFGGRVSPGQALDIMKAIESAQAGDWKSFGENTAGAILGFASPNTGGYINVLKAAQSAIEAKIENWGEDLYHTPAYNALLNHVNAAVLDGYKAGTPYLPSYLCGSDAGLRKQMQAVESRMFSIWSSDNEPELIELMNTHQARLRQRLGKDPVDRDVFNHFLATIVHGQRSYIITTYQRSVYRRAAAEARQRIIARSRQALNKTKIDTKRLDQLLQVVTEHHDKRRALLDELKKHAPDGVEAQYVQLATEWKKVDPEYKQLMETYWKQMTPLKEASEASRAEYDALKPEVMAMRKERQHQLDVVWPPLKREGQWLKEEKAAIASERSRRENLSEEQFNAGVDAFNRRVRSYNDRLHAWLPKKEAYFNNKEAWQAKYTPKNTRYKELSEERAKISEKIAAVNAEFKPRGEPLAERRKELQTQINDFFAKNPSFRDTRKKVRSQWKDFSTIAKGEAYLAPWKTFRDQLKQAIDAKDYNKAHEMASASDIAKLCNYK